jgi:hypothetical protein
MIGDCNQIVSLYVYLMSLRFDITKLKIKLLPEHVCLHYQGVDIEATTGEFHFYEEFDAICEIHEVVSVNLLDVRDYRRSFFKISDYDFLVCARLALLLSSNQKITEQNILVSYHNLGVAATKRDDFATAIHFFKLSRNQEALNLAYRNASIHYLQKNKLEKSKKYANLANDTDLLRQVDKKVAFLEYQKLWAKTQKYKTIDQQKRNRYTYERMYKLAKILEDKEAIASLKRLIGA